MENVGFVTGKRDKTPHVLRARSDGRARFSLSFAFPGARLPSAYVQLALIKNERHFFLVLRQRAYPVRGLSVIVSHF